MIGHTLESAMLGSVKVTRVMGVDFDIDMLLKNINRSAIGRNFVLHSEGAGHFAKHPKHLHFMPPNGYPCCIPLFREHAHSST